MASSTMMTEHHPDGNEDDDFANVSVSVSLDTDNDATSSGTPHTIVVAEPAGRIDDTSDEDLGDTGANVAADVGADEDDSDGGCDWENNGSIDEVSAPERDNVGERQENGDADDGSGTSSEVDVWSIIYGNDEQFVPSSSAAAAAAAGTTTTRGGGEVESPSNPTDDIPMDSYREQLEQDIHRLVERQTRLRQELERVEEQREQQQQSNSNSNSSAMVVVVLGRLLRIITYPITIVLTIVILILTLTFCIFPVVLFFIAAICLYYCMIDDPMPVHLLLRYMFTPEHDEVAGGGGPYGNTSQRTFASRKSITSKLIIRRLLKISSKNNEERDVVANDDDGVEYPRHHPFPIKISTLSSTLHFSQPLKEGGDDEEEEDGEHIDDGNNDVTVGVGASTVDTEHPTQFIPHYQRSFDSVTASEQREQEQRGMNPVAVSSASPNDDDSSSSSSSNSGSETNPVHRLRFCEEINNESDVTEDCGEITGRNFEVVGLEGDGEGSDAIDGTDTLVPGEAKGIKDESNDGDDVKPTSKQTNIGDYFGLDDGGDCRDKGTSCDICLLTFEVGDKVAFSPNCECSHHFHKDCILDWLQRKQTCPICRRDYLKGSEDGNV